MKFNKTNLQPFANRKQTAEDKTEKAMKITWKEDTRQFVSGKLAYIGKWCVANIHYDGATNDKEKYGISIYLPGIKTQQNQTSAEAAKARVEKIIAYWFAEAEK